MEITFVPSPDVSIVLNALLDILERRPSGNPETSKPAQTDNGKSVAQHRSIKIALTNLALPTYFSQTDPTPRIVANEQLILLEKNGYIKLTWLPNETNHILQTIILTEYATRNNEIFHFLSRTPIADNRSRLESLLLADKFRFQDDWRARAISHILSQLKAEKSPAPFSLTDSNLTLDLLAVLQVLPTLTAETPFRVFSVRVFNDSKRFEIIKNQFVSLARIGNAEWKRIPAEEVLRELNLVANPSYIHLSGNWQFTTDNGEILHLIRFTPSMGFPAAQTSTLQSVRAEFRPLYRKSHYLPSIHSSGAHNTNHETRPSLHLRQPLPCYSTRLAPAFRNNIDFSLVRFGLRRIQHPESTTQNC